MAYIKYKELTRYFNFNEKVPANQIPEYVYQYLDNNEKIAVAYKVRRDIIIFTDNKIVIFDIRGFFEDNRKIHILPYKSISSAAIEFLFSKVSLYLVMDSGYQIRLNFVSLSGDDKKEIRIAYANMMQNSIKKG